MKNYIITIILMSALSLVAQEFSRTSVDFSIRDRNKKSLRFNKELQSEIFTNFNFQDLNYETERLRELKEEIKVIEFLWNSGKDSVKIDLKSLTVGYPLQFKDILEKQIEVFSSSPKWQKYIFYKKNNDIPAWEIDHDLIEQIMYEGKVYSVLDELLVQFGYNIKGVSVEKIGYVTQKNIDKYGLKIDEEKYKDVPIPFIVWVMVEKIEEK